MRRLPPSVQTLSIRWGRSGALAMAATGALVLAAAPKHRPPVDAAQISSPATPPVLAEAEPTGPVMRTVTFMEPVAGRAINSLFGMRRLGGEPGVRMHTGVDIAAPTGTPVLASTEARVLRIGSDVGGYGNFVELTHPNGMTSFYAHLSRIDVASGDIVPAGARVGLVGSTGYSTGPHLHFEIRRDGVQLNPQRVMGRSFQVRATAPAS